MSCLFTKNLYHLIINTKLSIILHSLPPNWGIIPHNKGFSIMRGGLQKLKIL